MKLFLSVLFSLLIGLFNAGPSYCQLSKSWQLFETMHPIDKQLVALHINDAAGEIVDNTGTSDVTNAIQKAIDQVFNMGGGAIYVPAGTYRFDGTLTVREGVNLRGDFNVPDGSSVSGTIFEIFSGKGNAEGTPFITIRGCATFDGFTLWYPEQDASSITPYPPSIRFLKNDNERYSKHGTRIRCVNLVNSYFGIDIGIVNTALPMVCHTYGSPLKTGLRINECSDVSRIYDIHFSPNYWSESGLARAPAKNGPHSVFMYEEGQGVEYIRSDNGFNGFWYISGYSVGMSMNSSWSGGPFYQLEITGCKEALVLKELNQVPATFSRCIFEGADASLVLDELTGAAQFYQSQFKSGNYSVKIAPPGNYFASQVSFQDCVFEAPAQLTGMMASIVDSKFPFTGNHVILNQGCKNALLMDNIYEGARTIINNMSDKKKVLIRDTTKTYLSAPEFDYVPFVSHAPTRVALYIGTDFPGVVDGDGLNDGPGLQLALDKAYQDGGGIVYLPVGEYNISTPITIPENVELRGALDIPHHAKILVSTGVVHEFGTLIYVDHNRGSSEGATIVLSPNSGVRGISVYYPGQNFYETGVAVPYPWLFGLNGENIYIKNVCSVNAYQFIDIASAKCDNHYIENIISLALKTGIRVGKGSTGGRLRNVHLQNSNLGQSEFPTNDELLANWTHANLELFKFGNTVGQEMLFCFGRLCRAGIVLEEESGVGPSGLCIGFGVEDITEGACLDVKGNNGFNFINSSLLSENITVNIETADTLLLFNSRTKESRYFIKSSSRVGKLVFTQVLHRGENTIIHYNQGEVEVVNALFFNGLEIELNNPDIPLVLYGGFMKSGILEVNFEKTGIFRDYLPDSHNADSSTVFNPDLFLFPGDIESIIEAIENNKVTIQKEVKCYPNPADEVIHFEWKHQGDVRLDIYNTLGQKVYATSETGSQISIATNKIGNPGLYFARFSGKGWGETSLILLR
ncbi:MAG: glycosyl hydrolase family 28-related protein [Bacteroidia bacterium]|nr:glycosyl hydrolase family 28-related protein [Bacteroidia bacterium]